MRWTETEYERYLRNKPSVAYAHLEKTEQKDDIPDEPENKLQGRIQKWAKDKGYPIQSNRQSKRARGMLTPGWPDITLILPQRVLFIELKSKKGQLSPEQRMIASQFCYLGHTIYKVKTWKAFMGIINEKEESNEKGNQAVDR